MNRAEKALVKETKALIKEVEGGHTAHAAWVAIQDRVKRLCANRTQAEVAELVGKGAKSWVQPVVAWHARAGTTPFGGKTAEQKGRGKSEVKRMIREQPEVVAALIAALSPEDQRAIADALLKESTTESSLRDLLEPKHRSPRVPKSIERRLGEATFSLWEISEALLDEVPSPEERFRMLTIGEKAQRLAAGIVYLLDTGKLEDEFRKLVEEVGAES